MFMQILQYKILYLMLRSQIKLTSYDFSDLHITGEFDNRPGTGRFLRIFFCVVTYRTGAGRRLYMKTSARSILHEFPRAMIYLYQNSSLYLQRNSLLK